MKLARVVLVAALTFAFGSFAGCRGCSCVSGETTFESLDGKVRVELVRRTHWTGGRIGGPVSDFLVRIHASPPIDLPIACQYVDFAEDKDGKYVGYRCRNETKWIVVRLLDGTSRAGQSHLSDAGVAAAHLVECDAPVGTGRKPAFEKLEPVSKIADKIIACQDDDAFPRSDFVTLVRAVGADGGEEAANALAIRLAERSDLPSFDHDDAWDRVLASLSPAGKSRVLGAVCGALVDPRSPPPRYVRAARYCPFDLGPAEKGPGGGEVAPAIANAAAERLRALFAKEAPAPKRSFEIGAMHWATVLAPRGVGDLGCEAVTSLVATDIRFQAALGLVAREKKKCAADLRAATGLPCNARSNCDGGLCTPEMLERTIESAFGAATTPDGGMRSDIDLLPAGWELRLLAYEAQGPIPRELSVKVARFGYAIVPDDGPRCNEPGKTGAPCDCDHAVVMQSLCELPLDGGAQDEGGWCILRADDAHRKILSTRKCATLYSVCDVAECCPGLVCEGDGEDGGGVLVCRSPRSDASADGGADTSAGLDGGAGRDAGRARLRDSGANPSR